MMVRVLVLLVPIVSLLGTDYNHVHCTVRTLKDIELELIDEWKRLRKDLISDANWDLKIRSLPDVTVFRAHVLNLTKSDNQAEIGWRHEVHVNLKDQLVPAVAHFRKYKTEESGNWKLPDIDTFPLALEFMCNHPANKAQSLLIANKLWTEYEINADTTMEYAFGTWLNTTNQFANCINALRALVPDQDSYMPELASREVIFAIESYLCWMFTNQIILPGCNSEHSQERYCQIDAWCPNICCGMSDGGGLVSKQGYMEAVCPKETQNPCNGLKDPKCRIYYKENQQFRGLTADYWNHTCFCDEPGYYYDRSEDTCLDIDDCENLGANACKGANEHCVNILSSYICACDFGYYRLPQEYEDYDYEQNLSTGGGARTRSARDTRTDEPELTTWPAADTTKVETCAPINLPAGLVYQATAMLNTAHAWDTHCTPWEHAFMILSYYLLFIFILD